MLRPKLLPFSVALAAALLMGSTAASAAVPSAARDFSIIARDIIPSGQYGSVPPLPQADQQATMYNALTPLFGSVNAGALQSDFKPENVGSSVPGPFTTESVPHPGITILRDSFNVPHIYGATRDDVT